MLIYASNIKVQINIFSRSLKATGWLDVSKQGLTFYGHIKTAEQWTVIQQYSDWYGTLATDG